MINGETLRALIKHSKKTRVLTITVTIGGLPPPPNARYKGVKRKTIIL